MKKSTLLFLTVCTGSVFLLLALPFPGPRDERLPELNDFSYGVVMGSTTLNMLAKFADSSGAGEVTGRGRSAEHDVDYFTIRVNQAFWGCTNGQILTVVEWNPKTILSASHQEVDLYPSNHARIVFAVSTNHYNTFGHDGNGDPCDWNNEAHTFPISNIRPLFVLDQMTRSWWHEDYQGGHLTTYLTNVFRTIHTHRNWTNYYETCRNGASINSNRVKEDSFYDLRDLITRGTDEQLEFMDNDSLFPTNNRPFLDAQILKRQQKKR